ncbi:hypothetical protein MKW94_025062 [Papaver nudicaule]|uniref:Response regulatory domain-containing protein n=1 Tax=Papaver nudicaule TaxID=74823 RepID=A0AA41VV14_PAPNU|nr:hypothetical protein [Papaver nudicaule]
MEKFPAGLRVLVVDDDPTWLKILEKMLIKCSYEVTTCCLAREALDMLRERKGGFDIVISDVNMPDMDGFKLLEYVGLEMDLPVIMMSVDGETSRVMKGVQHGACDYLLKPVRMKELRIIWQHVFRKKMQEVKEIESQEGIEDTLKMRNGLYEFDAISNLLSGGHSDSSSAKKRKDMENHDYDENDFNDLSSSKKARVVWSVDLHQKFVKAVNHIGFDKVGPKKILDLMNVPWLTRENVASHLQKYRMYLGRLQKHNDPKNSFGAIKQPDFTSKDHTPTCFSFQSSSTMQKRSTSASCSFGYSANNILIQDVSSTNMNEDVSDIGSFMSAIEPKETSSNDVIAAATGIHGSTSLASSIPQKISWGRDSRQTQFIEEPLEEHKPYLYIDQSPTSLEHQMIQLDQQQPLPFVIPGTIVTTEGGNTGRRSLVRDDVSPYTRCTTNLFPAQPDTGIVSTQDFEEMFSGLPSIKNHKLEQDSLLDLQPQQQYFIKRSGSTSVSSEEDQQLFSVQDYGYFENVEPNNRCILSEYAEPVTELSSSQLCDAQKLNSAYLYEIMEYPNMDQLLFIA